MTETLQTEPSPEQAEAQREPIIEVTDVVKRFGNRTVLDHVSFKVYPGENMVVMGASGCGKSTLLKCMVGVLKPEEGSIKLFGKDITKIGEEELNEVRKKFGILFQSGALYNSMTVGENIALPLEEHTNLSQDIIHTIVKMKLELVGLRDFEGLKPAQLSGGMKKRVGLARALALDPKIVFYDEPSAGLDPITVSVIDQLMIDLGKKLNVTSVVVTHEMVSAFRIATKMVFLYDGKVLASGSPDEIKNSDNPYVKQFINGEPDGPIPMRRSSKDYIQDLMGL